VRRPCSRLPSQRTPLRRRYGKPGAHEERRIPPRERPHRLNCACCRPLRCKGGGTSASAACREWPACERCCGRPYYEPSIPTAPEPYLTPLLGEGCSCFCWLPLLDLFRLCRRCKGGTPPYTERGANPPHAEDMPPPPQLQICCWKALTLPGGRGTAPFPVRSAPPLPPLPLLLQQRGVKGGRLGVPPPLHTPH
jgi:hypothetical protein